MVNVCLSVYRCVCLSVCLSVCLPFYVCVPVCLCICLSLFVCVCVYLFVCLSVCVPVWQHSVHTPERSATLSPELSANPSPLCTLTVRTVQAAGGPIGEIDEQVNSSVRAGVQVSMEISSSIWDLWNRGDGDINKNDLQNLRFHRWNGLKSFGVQSFEVESGVVSIFIFLIAIAHSSTSI